LFVWKETGVLKKANLHWKMATFKPHYTLCPLLGAQNLVGVSADKEESMILVTLGPNIIVKQKV
jgi:hypothetical protein